MAKRILLFLLLLGTLFPCFSQNIQITDLELREDTVYLRYDLVDESEGRTYTVKLHAILEADTLELKKLSGIGIGEQIGPGSYQIKWDALGELQRYRGDVNFFITAVPSFYVDRPFEGSRVMIGNPILFEWFGNNSSLDSLVLQLYQYDTPMDTLVIVNQASRYTWKVPKGIVAGEGYRVKFIGSELTGIEDFSNSFTIRKKTPLWAILVPAGAAIVGAAAYLIWGRPEDPDLPAPEDPE